MPSARVEQALERLGENSTLTGDLSDAEAAVLLSWAEHQIMVADGAGADDSFASRVAAIRAAVREAARSSDDASPVVERAERALSRGTAQSNGTTVATAMQPRSQNITAANVAQSPVSATATMRSPWQILRRKLRRWTHRKAL